MALMPVAEAYAAVLKDAAPLPEEPVGKGAKWEHVSPLKSDAISLTQRATFTLVNETADSVDLDLTIEQTAPSQEMHAPGLPAGAKVTIKSVDSHGTGHSQVFLNRLVPKSNMSMTRRR